MQQAHHQAAIEGGNPHWSLTAVQGLLALLTQVMPLGSRWHCMSDGARALIKRIAVSALGVLLVLLVFRALRTGSYSAAGMAGVVALDAPAVRS